MNYPKNRYTGEKPWMNKEWLYNEYVVKDKSSQDIADEYGCTRGTIQSWLYKHKIKKDNVKRTYKIRHQYQDKDYLFREHIQNKKSMSQIARENGVSADTIRYHLKKNNIDYWQAEQRTFFNDEEEQEVIHLYMNGMSANKIAEKYNTSHNVVLRAVQKHGIRLRGCQEAQLVLGGNEIMPMFFDADWLKTAHLDEGKTCKDIGIELGIDPGAVRRQMHKFGIRTMTNSESKIGRMTGKDHPNWQGGLTPLKALLREYFHVNQAPVIAKRDNYTCQCCGATHTVLNIHHIKPFSDIVNEIVCEHPEYNVDNVDDRLKLYDIITHDNRFLNEDNLITYCKYCHYFVIHNYKQRKTISIQDSA